MCLARVGSAKALDVSIWLSHAIHHATARTIDWSSELLAWRSVLIVLMLLLRERVSGRMFAPCL